MKSDKDKNKALRWGSGNRKPSEKAANPHGPDYAISYACLECKTANKRHIDGDPSDYPLTMPCPICRSGMYHVGRNFRPPKKSDLKQWAKVEYLISHGFLFQKVRPNGINGDSVPYPDTLEEAREFVITYAKHAINISKDDHK